MPVLRCTEISQPMSLIGRKRTWRVQYAMSAYPAKADDRWITKIFIWSAIASERGPTDYLRQPSRINQATPFGAIRVSHQISFAANGITTKARFL